METTIKVGVDDAEGSPVPIPNTEVKLSGAENTWLETARKNREMPTQSNTPVWVYAYVGISLFFQAVTSQVFSAPLSLTSVFGMGTGGPSASSTPTYVLYYM